MIAYQATITFAEHTSDVAQAAYECYYQDRNVRSWLALIGPERGAWIRVGEAVVCGNVTTPMQARTAYIGEYGDKEWTELSTRYRARWCRVFEVMQRAANSTWARDQQAA